MGSSTVDALFRLALAVRPLMSYLRVFRTSYSGFRAILGWVFVIFIGLEAGEHINKLIPRHLLGGITFMW